VNRPRFLDQQRLTDPEAGKSFQAQKRKSSFWCEPSEITFRRLADTDALLGGPAF